MQDLHLVGFTKDHRHLIFSTRKDAKSGDFVVPVDDDLLDAVDEVASHRADHADSVEPVVETPPAQPRIEAQLSVREVQARLRAGDQVDAIAADAGVDVAWVDRFAPPVRAEQRRVVDRALTVPLTRPRAGESAVPLRRAIAAAMATRDVDLSAEEFEAGWSARLVGDSKWMVGFEFPNRGRKRRLEWKFDVGSGELTTKDRFASQLAFVESAEDLPPADVTVGSVPVHSGGGLVRGSVTSGGLARPGSSRVTSPSPLATPLPETVRRPTMGPTAPAPTRSRPPLPTVDPAPRPPVGPPSTPEPAAQTPTPPSTPDPTPVTRQPQPETDDARPEPAEPPPRRPDPAPRPVERVLEQPPLQPKPVDRRASSAPVGGRSTPAVVPPRRPAPVAPPTNASMANTRRPVPEIAPRLPVVIDADVEAPETMHRRPAMIEDRRALDDAVPSQPPSGGADSVVILRAVDEAEAPVDESKLADRMADDEFEPVDDEWNDDVDPEHDDEPVEDEWDDDVDADEVDAETEDIDADETDDDELSDDDDVEDEEWVDEDDDEEWVDEDEVDQDHLDEVDHDDLDEDEDEDDVGEDDVDEDDVDEDRVEQADEFDDESEGPADAELEPDDDDDVEHEPPHVRPVRATLRPGRSAPRRAPQRRSSVQFRPGAATQAGSGRAEPSPNGQAPDPESSDDDEIDTAAETPPTSRPRRRRTEPLRAR